SSFFSTIPRPPSSPLFPYTTLFRSVARRAEELQSEGHGTSPANRWLFLKCSLAMRASSCLPPIANARAAAASTGAPAPLCRSVRSEEHTSELQSLTNLVCRLLLEKK